MTPAPIHCMCRFIHEGQCSCPDVTLFVINDDWDEQNPFILQQDSARTTFFYCLDGHARIDARESPAGKAFSEEVDAGVSLLFCLNNGFSISHSGKPLQAVGLQLNPECFHAFACDIDQQPDTLTTNASFMLRRHFSLHLRILLEQIVNCQAQGPLRDVFLTQKKYELLYQQIELLDKEHIRKAASPNEYKAAQRAYAALLQDISKTPSLPALAASVGVNRMRLTELFRMIFGDTVFGILRRERLECARRLLDEKNKNITEIAYLCGFSSPSHLTKAFSSQFGISPKQYQSTK